MQDIEGLIDSQNFMRINHLFLMFQKDNFRSVKISKNFSVIFHLIFSVFSVDQSFVNSSVLNLFNCSCQWKCKISNDWLAAKIFFLLANFYFLLCPREMVLFNLIRNFDPYCETVLVIKIDGLHWSIDKQSRMIKAGRGSPFYWEDGFERWGKSNW